MTLRTRTFTSAGATLALVAAGVVAPALSSAAATTLEVSPTTPVTGQAFTVTVGGLTPGVPYRMPLTASTSQNDQTDVADANSCSQNVTVPLSGSITCTITEATRGTYELKLMTGTAITRTQAVTVASPLANVQAPRLSDQPGRDRDVITVYRTPNVASWTVAGQTVTFGQNENFKDVAVTHAADVASTDVPVVATAADGYVFSDGASTQTWTLRATTAATVPGPVSVTEPVKADPAGTSEDSLTFTASPNVSWTVNGTAVNFGSGNTVRVPVTGTRTDGKLTATVVATAAAGYTFADGATTRTFTYEFTDARSEPSSERVAGADRFETSVEIAKKYFPGQRNIVYVANGMNFPDALAAGPAAARSNAPLMLTAQNSVSSSVLAEIRRMQPQQIRVVGGPSAVSAGVAAQLGEIATVQRVSGDDRFATAARVSANRQAPTGGTVYIASGMNFPDALSGGSGAARENASMLLTDGSSLSDETVVELRRLAPTKVVLVGGESVVRASVARQVGDILGNVRIDRAAGSDRFHTSALIIENATGLPYTNSANESVRPSRVFLATGLNYPDALAGIPAAYSVNAPLALTMPQCLPTTVKGELDKLPLTSTVRLGSTNQVGDFSVLTGACN